LNPKLTNNQDINRFYQQSNNHKGKGEPKIHIKGMHNETSPDNMLIL